MIAVRAHLQVVAVCERERAKIKRRLTLRPCGGRRVRASKYALAKSLGSSPTSKAMAEFRAFWDSPKKRAGQKEKGPAAPGSKVGWRRVPSRPGRAESDCWRTEACERCGATERARANPLSVVSLRCGLYCGESIPPYIMHALALARCRCLPACASLGVCTRRARLSQGEENLHCVAPRWPPQTA